MDLANKGQMQCWQYTQLKLPSKDDKSKVVVGYVKSFYPREISALTDLVVRFCKDKQFHLAKIFYETSFGVNQQTPALNIMLHSFQLVESLVEGVVLPSVDLLSRNNKQLVSISDNFPKDMKVIDINSLSS